VWDSSTRVLRAGNRDSARDETQLRRRLLRRDRLELGAVVLGGAALQAVLAAPIRAPRIFGDELIYWELSRGLAWTGQLTVRGGASPRYGPLYPALLAAAQRIGGDQTSAYVVAQALNAVMFSLAAIPIYAVAARVLSRRYALLAALLALLLPSCVYTSAIMTESAFYPLFAMSVWLMVRALERPSTSRQLLVAVSVAATFLVRAQALVLLPSYLLAALLSAAVVSRDRRRSALVAAVRQQAPTVAVLALAAVAAEAVRGRATLGPYHVLVASYSARALAHWALANVADLDLYMGVIPLAAFGLLLVQAFSRARLSPDLRRLVILVACVGAGMLATVAVLGASRYGLGRVHERNLFYVVPFVLICFFGWLEAGLPRPRWTAIAVAVVVVALPLTIPAPAVKTSGEDGIALEWWNDAFDRPRAAILGMVAVAAVAAAVFLVSRRRMLILGVCVAAMAATFVGAEVHAVRAATDFRDEWRDRGWIDDAVGADAAVVALWTRPSTGADVYRQIQGLWADEFFNRSVRDVASTGALPDGLPFEALTIGSNGCVHAAFPSPPQYAVVESARPLVAPVVRVSPSGRATLYRLGAGASAACLVHVKHV
jgi:hypothetical protein